MGTTHLGSDPELDLRRALLAAARNGKADAREQLQQEYHVRVYSAAERAQLRYEAAPKMRGRASQRRLTLATDWTDEVA